MVERNHLTELQAENARLVALLELHGIEWRLPPVPSSLPAAATEVESTTLSTAQVFVISLHTEC